MGSECEAEDAIVIGCGFSDPLIKGRGQGVTPVTNARGQGVARSDRYDQLSMALDELMPRINSRERFRAARDVLAEMHALRPLPPREPNPDAALWVGSQILSQLSKDTYARLTIQQNTDRSYRAHYAVFCKSHFRCSTDTSGHHATAAEALGKARADLLEEMRQLRDKPSQLHNYDHIKSLLGIMIAEVEGVELCVPAGRPLQHRSVD